VLVSNRIEYCSNYSIRLEISNIRTALTCTVMFSWWCCNTVHRSRSWGCQTSLSIKCSYYGV